jgi:ATP/maltotriose-dependent transcriptional regulator MalT
MEFPPAAATLERGRAAFARRAWREAFDQLRAADRESALTPDDRELLGTAAYLIGEDEAGGEALGRLHQEFLERGQIERAVRAARSLGLALVTKGEHARGSGWLMRAQRVLEENKLTCVEQGYLLFPVALRSLMAGDPATAIGVLRQALEIGVRYGDRDLVALVRHAQGRALIKLGDSAQGVALLDEAMVAIEAGDVSPIIAGNVYCSVLEACNELYDLRRAQEWTSSLSRWCDAQPDLVPFRGQCLIRRAEVLQIHGDWDNALVEAQRARTRLSEPPPPQSAVGAAHYQEAELHRLRGDFEEAEEAYRAASKWSRKSRPGLALLRLAQGQRDAAVATIRASLDDAQSDTRPEILAAWTEIALAANDTKSARAAANELAQIALQSNVPLLEGLAAQAEASVLLAEGDAQAALTKSGQAWALFQELAAPYHAARARVLIGSAARALGDHDAAARELDAARWVFDQLGAAPDVARVDELSHGPAEHKPGGLTAREVQVLRLVAQGKTNKAIASELFISEKTVHRHMSNIFLKLNLATRAAATAYAYQHGLA